MCFRFNFRKRLRPDSQGYRPSHIVCKSSLIYNLRYNLTMVTRFKQLPAIWWATPLLLLFFYLAVSSMVDDSPTMDEQNHVTRGLTFLTTGDPRFSLEHPPLINTLSALPAFNLLHPFVPLELPYWGHKDGWYLMADALFWNAGNDVTQLLFLARLPIIFLTMGLGIVGYHFARQLWGRSRLVGLTTLFLLLFDPNLLAHGRYSTTDMGGTLFILLATWALWRLWQVDGRHRGRWHWGRWVLAGICMGLAFGSKLSALVFVPIWLLLAGMPAFIPPWQARSACRRIIQTGTAGIIAYLVVWALFRFEWKPLFFESTQLSPLNRFSAPMPTFVAGIEQILFLSGGGRPSYLLGNFSKEGFISYFPVAFATKTPIPTLILLIWAMIALLKMPATRRKALFLLLPALSYFLISMGSALNIGYRHLLPILPLLYLLIAGIIPTIHNRWQKLLAILLLGGLLSATLQIHPHYLSSFNQLAGGAENAGNILIDSNVDWGQDLIRLQQWATEKDVTNLKLGYFGSADPAYYLSYSPLPGLTHHHSLWWDVPFNRRNPEPGTYAISVSNLYGEIPLEILAEKSVYAAFRARQPDHRIGNSIFIYQID